MNNEQLIKNLNDAATISMDLSDKCLRIQQTLVDLACIVNDQILLIDDDIENNEIVEFEKYLKVSNELCGFLRYFEGLLDTMLQKFNFSVDSMEYVYRLLRDSDYYKNLKENEGQQEMQFEENDYRNWFENQFKKK